MEPRFPIASATALSTEWNRDFLSRLQPDISTPENPLKVAILKSRFLSFSGKPYQIRKPDGTLVTASAFFHARLSEYDKAK